MPATARRDVFHGIADPTRRTILTMIAERPMNSGEIADHFDMSRPAVSQHLKILAECDLIAVKKQGRERLCIPKPGTLSQIADWIEPFRELWESRFEKLDDLLDELQAKNQNNE